MIFRNNSGRQSEDKGRSKGRRWIGQRRCRQAAFQRMAVRHLNFETLEDRRLLAVMAELDVVTNDAIITGSAAADVVTMEILNQGLADETLRISDPDGATAGAGFTQVDANTVTVLTSDITGGNIRIDTLDGADILQILSTPAGITTHADLGVGVPDDAYIGVTAANFNAGLGTLDFILGTVNVRDSGSVGSLYVDDSGNTVSKTVTFTSSSITGAAPATINYENTEIHTVQLALGSGDDTINVASTGPLLPAFGTGTTIFGHGGDDTFNIDVSQLGGQNTFVGGDGDDTFNLNVTDTNGITAPVMIEGNDNDAVGDGGRDVVRIVDVGFGAAAAHPITMTYTGGGPDGSELSFAGIGPELVTMNTVQTVAWVGQAGNDAVVTVVGTATGDDLITVAPIDANRALVFNNDPADASGPFNGPPEDFAARIPGVSGGSVRPDLDLSGLANTTGLTITDSGPGTGDRLYIYGQSTAGLNDGNTFDPFGFGDGQILPAVSEPNSFNQVNVNDTQTTVDGLIAVNYNDNDFEQADPQTQPSVVVNSGFEGNPPSTPGIDVADDVTLTLSASYRFQINGGDPDPATTGITPPNGDRLTVDTLGAQTINVWSDKASPPNVQVEAQGTGLLPFGFSSIENLVLDANGGTVNLLGDNNFSQDQPDNFVVRGTGPNAFTLEINGSAPIQFEGVSFLNAMGGEEVDTLDITPYADNTPQGWGIQVFVDEGVPDQTNGAQQDLLIYNTVAANPVSEDIVIQPSGPMHGELRVTNAVDGSIIVVISYVNNLDIIVNDNDGFESDTDTLTLRGTSPGTPATSGDEVFLVDFTNAGTVAEPIVTVSDANNPVDPLLYRVRDFVGFDTLTIELLDGDDQITVLGSSNAGNIDIATLNIFGGTGDDTLILDNSNGLSEFDNGLFFDGGPGNDELRLIGSTTIESSVYSVGPGVDEGFVLHTLGAAEQRVYFAGLQPVVDLVPAANLVVNATDADNAINYEQSDLDPTWGKVSIDGFEPIHFANKQELIINGLAGSDTINLNNPTTPTGLVQITVHGGDPTASDVLIVNGTAGADNIHVTPTAADTGEVTGAQPVPVTFSTIESLIINGQGGDDTLNVNTPATDSTVVLTPGSTVDSGQLQVDSLVPLSFTNLGAAGELNITSTGGTDTLIYNGTEASDTFVVPHPTAAAPSIGLNDQIGVSTLGVANYTLRGLGGDDTFTITPQAEVAIRVEGDEPSGSDTLNFVRDDADGLATTVVVELDAVPADPSLIQTIEQPGLGAVTLLGIETANINANVADVFVAGTRFDDVIHFTPHSASSATVTAAGIATVFHFTNVPAANTFRVSGGSFGFADKVVFHGTNGRDRIRVDVPDRTVELDVQDMGFPPSPLATWRSVTLDDGTAAFGTPGIIESVQVLGHDGNDTFHVVPGPAVGNGLFVKIDGGSPLASDALVITELNGANNPTPLAPTDFVVVGKSRVEDAGNILVFRDAERLPGIAYESIETVWANVDPVDPNTGEPNLLILGPDMYEPNDFRATAAFLGSGSTINVQNLALFPNDLEHIGVPADQDYFRVVAEKTGTLDFQVYFRTFDPDLLPGGGQITIDVLDAAGNVIPDFTVIPGDGDARARIPAVAGQTYYLRVLGETGDVINGYDLTIINTPAPVPFDLELADHLTILTGAQEVPPVDTIASGTANFQYDAAANTFDLDLFVFGIELTDMTDLPELTGAHIHRGAIGVNGPVIVDFGIDDWVQEGAGIRLRLTDHPFPAAEIDNLLAGDTYINVHSTANPPGEVRGQILVPNVLGVSDTGRSQFDNVTNDSTPTIFVRLDDAVLLNDLPGNAADFPGALPPAGTIPIPHNPSTDTSPLNLAPGYRVAVYDETDMHNPVLLGFAQPVLGLPGVYSFETPLFDGSHFLSARVQMIDPADNDPEAAGQLRATGFGARSQSLEIIVDTVPPPVVFGSIDNPFDGLLPPDDTHVIPNPGTISDRITSELAPTFWGRAEANAIIRLYADVDGDGVLDPEVDVFLGQTTAIPLDGTNQEPNGFWQIQSVVNLNNPDFFPDPDGLRTIFVTAEDLAGNVNAPDGLAADTLQIFIDAQGPVIEEVFITDAPDYNLFAPKPDTDGPTPLVNSLTIQFMDLPERVAPDFLFDALKQDVAEHPGHYLLVGDHNGVIPIVDVIVTQEIGPDNIARAWVELVFRDPGPDGLFFTEDDIGAPLPDDRFTLTISDSIIDPAGNRLDGETNAIQPLDPPLFPTGDGIPGGDFVARFTVDSRAEIGVWAAGSVYIDTNGNFIFDPDNQDFTNRDIVYKLGFASDHIFAGNFKAPGDAEADGFDKLAGYGRVGGEFRFLIDTTNDGVPDLVVTNPLGSNGLPVAGNFDGDPTTGDQVGVLVAGAWHLDTTGDYILDTILPTSMVGYPVVGDFDGDGLVDLGVWRDDTFFLDLSSIGPTANPALPGLNGSADVEFRFGFPGVRERPIAADFDGDGIDDLGLFVPDRSGMPPSEAAEWYILVSGGRSIVDRLEPDPDGPGQVVNFTPTPFGDDIFAQFGDMFAQPVVGNFDPPVAGVNLSQYGLLSFTNPDNPLDVNGDGLVTPLDALIVINALNRDGAHELPAIRADAELSPPFLDVNGDNMLSPLDALLVINHLNSVSPDGEPGGLVAEGESDFAMQADPRELAMPAEHHAVGATSSMLPTWWEEGRRERSAFRSTGGELLPLDGTQRAMALDEVVEEWQAARMPDARVLSGRQPLAELDREIDWDEIVEETWWQ